MDDSPGNRGEPKGLMHLLRSLRSRNYRLYFSGQGVSLIGTWMQWTALPWLVSGLAPHDPKAAAALLGLVSFVGQVPGFIFMPLGGILADRLDRRRILITTQILMMVQAFALYGFVLGGSIRIWQVIALSAFLGVVNAVDMPTRQAFVVEMTENREDLSNAIALNSTMFNGARLAGPAIAGVLIRITGVARCFLFNGISYIAVIAGLVAMRIPHRHMESRGAPILGGMWEGLMYSIRFRPILYVLMFLFVASMMGTPLAVLMPLFARDKALLHGNSTTYGLLTSSIGAGALLGAGLLASRRSVLGLGGWIPRAGVITGVGIIGFSFSRSLWLSMPLLAGAGFGMIVGMASCNTIIQTIVDEDKRGRVMSLYTMSFMGGAPLGSLFAGVLAPRIGSPMTVMVGGLATIVGALLFATRLPSIRRSIHPIYVRMGIIPEMANGLDSASQLLSPPEEEQRS